MCGCSCARRRQLAPAPSGFGFGPRCVHRAELSGSSPRSPLYSRFSRNLLDHSRLFFGLVVDCETIRPQPSSPYVAAMATVINWLDPSRPKLPPGALVAIPDDLLADIYTIWLLLKDVCRLDSAVCSKIWRPPLLRLVSTKVLRFLREEIDVLDPENLCTTTHRALNEITSAELDSEESFEERAH